MACSSGLGPCGRMRWARVGIRAGVLIPRDDTMQLLLPCLAGGRGGCGVCRFRSGSSSDENAHEGSGDARVDGAGGNLPERPTRASICLILTYSLHDIDPILPHHLPTTYDHRQCHHRMHASRHSPPSHACLSHQPQQHHAKMPPASCPTHPRPIPVPSLALANPNQLHHTLPARLSRSAHPYSCSSPPAPIPSPRSILSFPFPGGY